MRAVRDAFLHAFGLLVGLRAREGDQEAVAVLRDVADVERRELGAVEAAGEAEQQERAVADADRPREVERRDHRAELLSHDRRLAALRHAVHTAYTAPDVAQCRAGASRSRARPRGGRVGWRRAGGRAWRPSTRRCRRSGSARRVAGRPAAPARRTARTMRRNGPSRRGRRGACLAYALVRASITAASASSGVTRRAPGPPIGHRSAFAGLRDLPLAYPAWCELFLMVDNP